MRLLVSVRDAIEARAALDGGADIVDAKDPTVGAMGPVSDAALREIADAVGGDRPVSVALGDPEDARAFERLARAGAMLGVAYVKVGFAGARDVARARGLLDAAVDAAGGPDAPTGVIAVAYADAARADCLAAEAVIDLAARAGARGLLVDTLDKERGGLFDVAAEETITDWIHRAREASLLIVALAGKLSGPGVARARSLGADIAGVRGAACEDGRTGALSADRVATLAVFAGRTPRARATPLAYDLSRSGETGPAATRAPRQRDD